MAESSEPCDDDDKGEGTLKNSSALERFFQAALKVAQVEHESEIEIPRSPSICDLKDIVENNHSTRSQLRLIKDDLKTSPTNVLSFQSKVIKPKEFNKKNTKG